MIKLITIDLDGTLFDNKKVISAENKLAIKQAKELGVKIVIATGRPISGVLPVLEELNLTSDTDYVIIYNGAKILNVKTKELVFSSVINGKTVKELYKESKRLNVFIHAFRKNEELICQEQNPYTDIEAKINHLDSIQFNFNEINDNDEFLKCMFVDSDENITRVMNEINPKFYKNYSMVRSSKIFLEFLNKTTHKGHALEALAEYLNINIKDTMAIGDAGNDLPMIKAAGIGVAMENAFPEIKAYADYITASNLDDGVAKAIKKFVLEQKEIEA
ncbi:MAG: Cof-type HAD-IIB family hydrolase [Anaeroplasma sp.]